MVNKIVTAKVKKEFPGVPDGETQVRGVKVDEIITGELAKVAIAEGWADEVDPDAPADPNADTSGKSGKRGK